MLFFVVFCFLKEGNFSLLEINFLKKNPLAYQGILTRESEISAQIPFYFYLKEIQFFKSNGYNFIPYQIRFRWDVGWKLNRGNFILKIFHSHICNHGIDHPGTDRRQWNQVGVQIERSSSNFTLGNSIGYIVSPFGPKRKDNNYNWILLQSIKMKKDHRLFSIFLDVEFFGTLSSNSLQYSPLFKMGIQTRKTYSGAGAERWYALDGILTSATTFYEIFAGLFEKKPSASALYGYLLKNPEYSFISEVIFKYPVLKENFKLLTNLRTVSPPKTQQPKFYDYQAGLEISFKNKSRFIIYHRMRKDGNEFDGKGEITTSVNFKKGIDITLFKPAPAQIDFIFDYSIFKRDYPYHGFTGFYIKNPIYKWDYSIFLDAEINFLYFLKKGRGDFLLEFGPSITLAGKSDLIFSFKEKITDEKSFESYGRNQHILSLSLKFPGKNL